MQISDEYIDKLIMLFEHIRDNQFEIGDTLVLLVDSQPEHRQDIMNYVAGKLAVSPSTLYDYENTARRWSPDKRQEYAALDYIHNSIWTVGQLKEHFGNEGSVDLLLENRENGNYSLHYYKAVMDAVQHPLPFFRIHLL